MKWRIRDLLNPVMTRSLLYGTNPFDMEYVLKRMDAIKIMSGKEIKNVWLGEWYAKADKYHTMAEEAVALGNRISACAYSKLETQCHYACYMINMDDVEKKQSIYEKLMESYKNYLSYKKNSMEYVEIPTVNGIMPAYLHYPDNGEKGNYPCVITYSGIGSCKEELEMLAEPLLQRGMAVLATDMPGTGSALFHHGLKCNGQMLDPAFDAAFEFVSKRAEIDSSRIGNFGLCMGGGYAFRATVKHPEIKCCASLFPLFLNIADMTSIPIWMKRGKWSNFQYGLDMTQENENYLEGMKILEEGTISADFLMIYSEDDNWMTSEASMSLYEKALGKKEKIFVDEKPAYVSEESIMHAMPVGEQFHWIQHKAADFLAARLTEKE